MKLRLITLLPLCLLLLACSQTEAESPLSLFFTQPAKIWEETLPLGNGRIGMMPDGGIDRECIVLNEISLWTGSKQDADNPYAIWTLPAIRDLLFRGYNKEAQELMYRSFICKGAGTNFGDGGKVPYGTYQLLGNLLIDYDYPNTAKPTAYRRSLDLEEAIASVSFRKGATTYTRQAFTSAAGDIGVIHLQAQGKSKLSFTVGMSRPENYAVSVSADSALLMQGQLPNGTETAAQKPKGMRYLAQVRILTPQGGKVILGDSALTVQGAPEAVLLVSMATNYWDKDAFGGEASRLLAQAAQQDYPTLKQAHIEAYSPLFHRVKLQLGQPSPRDKQPIDQRLIAFEKEHDPSLAALYFQYGRYLLISSTRPGSLPPNLQGLWANTLQTPWNGDYHLNINLQMNHWPAEVGNLSERHLPLVEWTRQQVESGRKTAKTYYNARGWATHILGNVWQFTSPGQKPSWGATNTTAAWLCAHLYDHYRFTCDTAYLRSVYPIMKEAALFFTDLLVRNPRTGYWVTAPTTSPENAYLKDNVELSICAGSTMDNQILREFFTNTLEVAQIVSDTDTLFTQALTLRRSQLMPTSIAPDGRIMEWLEPYQEVEPTHRHVSHLYGLYPGSEISVSRTPELVQAARRTLEVRGDKSTGWSTAWKINFWARLHDGNRALDLLSLLLRPTLKDGERTRQGGSYPNLFCAHPPFQIDGNFGGCAGIAEMLLQSQEGYIDLLPALPEAWSQGRFEGLRVRGGGEVAAQWSDNRLQRAILTTTVANAFTVRVPPEVRDLSILLNGQPLSLPIINSCFTVPLALGDRLETLFFY